MSVFFFAENFAEHQSIFLSLPVVGFKRGKSLKDFLVQAKLPQIKAEEGCSEKCDGKRFGVCNYISETSDFKDSHGGKTYNIQSNKLNCNSKNVVYLVQCRTYLQFI